MNHVDKYYWIVDHPSLTKFCGGQAKIELNPQCINPENNTIDLVNPLNNTKFEWWVELSYAFSEDWMEGVWELGHDMEFDTGGDSAEEAINNLYELVLNKFGKYDCE
jgi:hypothetical protein